MVIGGAGYIGSHVAKELLGRGHSVTVYDNLSSGLRENLIPGAAFVHGDIHDGPALARAMAGASGGGFGALVHLAAAKAAGESMLSPEKYSRSNIAGSIGVISAAAEAGIENFVFSSSAAVYGEPEYLPVDERHPTNPENYYGFTKLETERILAWHERLRGMRHACLRYFNAAGYDAGGAVRGLELSPANLLPVVMEVACGIRPELQIFGSDYDTPDGTCIRDYVHVSDLAAAHAAALDYICRSGKSVTANLGSGSGASVAEVAAAARRISGRPIPARIAPRRPGDPARLTASSELARELLGWEPRSSGLETLVETSWKAYRALAR